MSCLEMLLRNTALSKRTQHQVGVVPRQPVSDDNLQWKTPVSVPTLLSFLDLLTFHSSDYFSFYFPLLFQLLSLLLWVERWYGGVCTSSLTGESVASASSDQSLLGIMGWHSKMYGKFIISRHSSMINIIGMGTQLASFKLTIFSLYINNDHLQWHRDF